VQTRQIDLVCRPRVRALCTISACKSYTKRLFPHYIIIIILPARPHHPAVICLANTTTQRQNTSLFRPSRPSSAASTTPSIDDRSIQYYYSSTDVYHILTNALQYYQLRHLTVLHESFFSHYIALLSTTTSSSSNLPPYKCDCLLSKCATTSTPSPVVNHPYYSFYRLTKHPPPFRHRRLLFTG